MNRTMRPLSIRPTRRSKRSSARRPDIIVGYGLFNASEEDVAAVGIPNIVIDGECGHGTALTEKTDFDAIFADVERLADMFEPRHRRANLANSAAELDDLMLGESDSAGSGRVLLLRERFISARGGQGIADDVLARAGFDNVYGDEDSVYLEANIETLLDADPHTLVLAYGLYGESFEKARAHLLTEPGASDLTAVREGRIVGVPTADLSPDPGALRGLRAVLEGTGALAG